MEYLIKVSAILILFYTCYKLFLNRETFFESNRSFLLVGLITAFVLPLIVITKHIEIEPSAMEGAFVYSNSTQATVDNSINYMSILTYSYLAGVLFFFGRFLFQFSSLVILYIKSTKQRVASFIYVITKNALSPFSFFNWIVFNPEHFNDTELEQIIIHEKVHAQQLHSVDILIVELTSILLWFNPFIWLYKKDLCQNLEFIADKNAQATTHCKKSYQHLLLKTSAPNYQMALTNNFYNSLIKKRIVMLHKNKSNNRNQLKYLLILPALAVFLMSFNTKEVYVNKEATSQATSTVLDLNDFESSNIEVNTQTTKPVSKNAVKESNPQISKKALKQDIVAYFIESTYTDNQLDNVIGKLKTHGVILKIKGVKRNSDNEITALKIDAKSDNSNTNFSINNDSAIKTVKITYNAKDNSISIGNTDGLLHDKDYMYTHKDGVFTIDKLSDKGNNVFVYSSDNKHEGDHEVIESNSKIIIKSGNKVNELKKANKDKNVFVISGEEGETFDIIKADTLNEDSKLIFKLKSATIKSKNKDGNIFMLSSDGEDSDKKVIIKSSGSTLWTDDKDSNVIIKSSKGKSLWTKDDSDDIIAIQTVGKEKDKFFISTNGGKDPLFIVDDKEVTKKDLDLDPNNIESVKVVKGEAATKLYGEKGKDGVVVITTKKKKD